MTEREMNNELIERIDAEIRVWNTDCDSITLNRILMRQLSTLLSDCKAALIQQQEDIYRLEGLLDVDPYPSADAYDSACDQLEAWHRKRAGKGLPPLCEGSLVDGLSSILHRIDMLEERSQQQEAGPVYYVPVVKALLSYAESKTCSHETTHRGGAIWEICDACGAKWADDEGGKPEWVEPVELESARALLASMAAQPQVPDAGMTVGTRYEYTKIGSAEQKWWGCVLVGFDGGQPIIRTDAGHYHLRPLTEYRFRAISAAEEVQP